MKLKTVPKNEANDNKTLYIFDKCCGNCLCTNKRLMHEDEANDLIQENLSEGKYFPCHVASFQGKTVCCATFAAKYKNTCVVLTMGRELGVVERVEMPDKEVQAEIKFKVILNELNRLGSLTPK